MIRNMRCSTFAYTLSPQTFPSVDGLKYVKLKNSEGGDARSKSFTSHPCFQNKDGAQVDAEEILGLTARHGCDTLEYALWDFGARWPSFAGSSRFNTAPQAALDLILKAGTLGRTAVRSSKNSCQCLGPQRLPSMNVTFLRESHNMVLKQQ